MSTTRLPDKAPAESVVVSFDFSAEASAVSTPSVTCSVKWAAAVTTADPSPASVLQGAPQISGTNPAVVLQRVQGGLHRNDYLLSCVALDAAGNTLMVSAVLPVRESP